MFKLAVILRVVGYDLDIEAKLFGPVLEALFSDAGATDVVFFARQPDDDQLLFLDALLDGFVSGSRFSGRNFVVPVGHQSGDVVVDHLDEFRQESVDLKTQLVARNGSKILDDYFLLISELSQALVRTRLIFLVRNEISPIKDRIVLKLGAGEKVERGGRDHHREEIWQKLLLVIQSC